MAKRQTGEQKDIVARVMGEFKRGALETRGRPVEDSKQAIAIALSEAGASDRVSEVRNRKRLRRTTGRETRADLYAEAKRRGIEGRSKMTRDQLAKALGR